MKSKILAACLVVVVAVGGLAMAQKTTTRQQWEYKVISTKDDMSEAALNTLGNEGWEIIPMRSEDVGSKTVYYFKRQK